jgi:hypothetical protein
MNLPNGITLEQPPGAANWGAGLLGPNNSRKLPLGSELLPPALQAAMLPPLNDSRYESPGAPMAIPSLYAQQLRQRLGGAADR